MTKRDAERIAKAMKPPRCPKCGAEVDTLNYSAMERVKATYYGNDEYGNWDTLETDYKTIEYRCPKCGALLFKNQIEADKFLNGEE